ncbi:MAG: NERD domain-containing protein [Chloroflexi bacterium]|nr:NERD domain-containing protein [Chloroflexota bacterium]
MDVIAPSRPLQRTSFVPLLGGTVFGTLFIVGGLALAYLAFATPFLQTALPSGRPDAGQTAMGMATWAVALVAPAGFVLVGASRLARMLKAARGRVPHRSTALKALDGLPDDITVASGLTLPDGRGVSELVIGPFGAAVIRELPPGAVTRIHGENWQVRTSRGWVSLENPLDRASRDAERVRRWLTDDDDFLVKVYSAVVGPAPTVARTPHCAVLAPDQLAAWIAALPAQRSLNPGRLQRILDVVRAAA